MITRLHKNNSGVRITPPVQLLSAAAAKGHVLPLHGGPAPGADGVGRSAAAIRENVNFRYGYRKAVKQLLKKRGALKFLQIFYNRTSNILSQVSAIIRRQ